MKEKNERIDIVILWVDGEDEKWKKKKQIWAKKYKQEIETPERFRNWDNLHYLFRGIERFAPWFNHIYLITDNQKPEWLNVHHSKLTVVDHSDIIDESNLPLFNSNAIEINIHKIPGLSEKFIYFNDDMFLLKETQPTDFFQNGLPVDSVVLGPIYADSSPFSHSIYNNVKIINDNFNKREVIKKNFWKWYSIKSGPHLIRNILLSPYSYFTGFYSAHLCVPFLKSTFEEVWNLYRKELNQASKSKFRSKNDYTQWLFQYWQFAIGKFYPRSYKFGKYYSLSSYTNAKYCAKKIERQKHKVICINDSENLKEFEKSKDIINDAFKKILPEKSSFENYQ